MDLLFILLFLFVFLLGILIGAKKGFAKSQTDKRIYKFTHGTQENGNYSEVVVVDQLGIEKCTYFKNGIVIWSKKQKKT